MRSGGRTTPGRAWGRALALIIVLVAMLAGNLADSHAAAHDEGVHGLALIEAGEGASPAPDDGDPSATIHCNTGLGCMALLPVTALTPLASASGDDFVAAERHFTHASPIFGMFRPPRHI